MSIILLNLAGINGLRLYEVYINNYETSKFQYFKYVTLGEFCYGIL